MIRVQTNGNPDHCVNNILQASTSANVDFKVKWNRVVDKAVLNYASTAVDSGAKTTEILCDLQRTATTNMVANTGYVACANAGCTGRRLASHGGGGDALATCSGVALTGGLIYNALDGDNLDAVQEEYATLDQCLQHPSPQGKLHYH